MDLQRLTQPAAPWHHLLVATPSDACDAVLALEQSSAPRLAARVVRGPKATTVAAFFDECSAALQFPYYFGENWDAVRDCLTDLAWLRAEAVVLVLAEAIHLLEKAPPKEQKKLRDVLDATAQDWNQTKKPGKATSFHVVWHATPEQETALKSRLQALGLSFNQLL